jgi:glutamyl-tRNA synthetase
MEKKQACPCRSLSVKEQKERWKKMFDGYEPGEAVLRIKTDVKHPNPAVRDWPAFRINDAEHPRIGKKYRVWPLMNFAVAVDDHDNGMTHVIRGKDHIVNMDRQSYIFKYFGWEIPEYIHIGRINFEDLRISTSGFREAIEKKEYNGWDDPRLPTMAAFRRRGLQPAAFIRYITELGPSKVDKTVSFQDFMKAIYSFNRASIDKQTHRYFFVENPKEITIKNAPKIKAEVPIHPDVPSHGTRHLPTEGKFYIEDKLEKGKAYRFMHLYNIKDNTFHSLELQPDLNARLIHWLPVSKDLVKVKIVMPDNSIKSGLAEHTIKQVRIDQVIQFERKCFCRLDSIEKDTYVFYFTHP